MFSTDAQQRRTLLLRQQWVLDTVCRLLRTTPTDLARQAELAPTTLTRALDYNQENDSGHIIRGATWVKLTDAIDGSGRENCMPVAAALRLFTQNPSETIRRLMLEANALHHHRGDVSVAPLPELLLKDLAAAPVHDAETTPPPSGPPPGVNRIIDPDLLVQRRNMEVYDTRLDTRMGTLTHSLPFESLPRPAPLLTIHDPFAFYVVEDTMAPAYMPGDLVFGYPRPPFPGDDVFILRPIGADEGDLPSPGRERRWHNRPRQIMLGHCLNVTAEAVSLRQYNGTPEQLTVRQQGGTMVYVVCGKYNRRR